MTDCNLESIAFPRSLAARAAWWRPLFPKAPSSQWRRDAVALGRPETGADRTGRAFAHRPAPQGQLPTCAFDLGPTTGVRAGAEIRRLGRPRRAAGGPGAANRGGRRWTAHRCFHLVPVRAENGPGRCGSPARGAGGFVHRVLCAPAPPPGAGFQRHRRSGARQVGKPFISRVTTATALPLHVFRGD